MLKTLEKLFSHSKCYQAYNVLSDNIRSALNVRSEKYDKNRNWQPLTKQTKGSNRFTTFIVSICHKDKLPAPLVTYKDNLPNNPNINNLIEPCNNLRLSTDTLDLAGCIFPDQSHVNAAPNGCRFILSPTKNAVILV